MDQLDEIIEGIGKYEQMLMFTATVTREVNDLIKRNGVGERQMVDHGEA